MRESASARGQARGGGAGHRREPPSRGIAARSERAGRRALSDGTHERSRARALGALRLRSRLRAGRARDGRRARSRIADLLEVYEVDRPRTIEALYRRRGREHRAVALALPPQRALPLAGPSVSLPAAAGLGLRAREAPRDRVRSAVSRLRGHAALEARGGPRRAARRRTSGRIGASNTLVRDRGRLARREHRRRRRLRSARRPRHRRGPDRRRRRRRRRGAGRHRGGAAAGLRGDRWRPGATRRPTASPRRWTSIRSPGRTSPASEADLYVNATPVGWRDDDPPAIPESFFEARPLVFDCVYRRDGRETVDDPRRRAPRSVRRSRACRCSRRRPSGRRSCFGVDDVTLDEVAAHPPGGLAR